MWLTIKYNLYAIESATLARNGHQTQWPTVFEVKDSATVQGLYTKMSTA